jgi:sigma-E factor negative regulatory protein RseA
MNEKISTLMDGEASDPQVIQNLCADPRARETWNTYHLIGDALRGTPPLSEGFAARVAWRLADEPAILAPRNLPQERRPRFALAAAASFAAVALVGWLAFAPQPQAPVPVVAKVEKPIAIQKPKPAIVPLPSSTNDYLLAHQGFSPRLAIQGMAPYVITVSEQPRK